MDDKTKAVMLTMATGAVKKVLMLQAAGLVSHGLLSSNNTEVFVSLGMAAIGAVWSFWNDYGKAIVLSKLEVMKAKSLAQAAKMREAGVTPVTTNQIAAQSPTLTAVEVAKTIATLPAAIQANVVQSGVMQKAITPLILIAVLILGALALPGDAMAQGGPLKLKPLTGNLGNDLGITKPSAAAGGSALDSAVAALAKPFQDIAAFIGEDADLAVSLSTIVPEIQDGHGQQCWMAMSSFGKVIKAHPVPITFHVMNDFETLRLLAIATNRLCANVHCTQVFADGSAMAQAASPMPLLIPTLHDLCTKVPQIALVDPVPAAAPADTPATAK